MSILTTVLKYAAPLPNLEEYESFLFLGPHPDDIEIGAGATAAKLAKAGKKVTFLICIDGRFGDGATELRGDELVKRRKEESVASAKVLGVEDVRFLDFCDGGFYDYKDLEKSIAREIGNVQPDVLFAPDPDVKSECHRDHKNVGNIAKELSCLAPYPGIMSRFDTVSADIKAIALYMTADPNQYINTTYYLDNQMDSIFKCHLSQFPEGCESAKSISLYLKLRAYDYGIRNFCRTAEGFRVLGQTHMHCMPESARFS